jgi:hypothetical protein
MSKRDFQLLYLAAHQQVHALEDGLCNMIRTDVLVPFCERKGWRFSAGMGSWSVIRPTGDYIDNESLPKVLRYMLCAPSLANPVQQLGSMIEGYTPTTWKKVKP